MPASLVPAWPRGLGKINGVGFHYIAKTGFPLPKNQRICKKRPRKSSVFSTNCATQANSPVGAYSINVTQGTLKDANYTFVFVSGTLTVTHVAAAVEEPADQ